MRISNILSAHQRSVFFGEFENHVDGIRPSIVLDCSDVIQMDRSTVELLIYCLEEAMKRNGDVRLAAVSSQARATLRDNGLGDLFQFYETNADAVSSFRSFSSATTRLPLPPELHRKSLANAV
jgi:anti-anti-sigma factor